MAVFHRLIGWYCDRCHRDVGQESVEVDSEMPTIDVRCPLCEMLVRFVTPSRAQLASPDGGPIVRSNVVPLEVH